MTTYNRAVLEINNSFKQLSSFEFSTLVFIDPVTGEQVLVSELFNMSLYHGKYAVLDPVDSSSVHSEAVMASLMRAIFNAAGLSMAEDDVSLDLLSASSNTSTTHVKDVANWLAGFEAFAHEEEESSLPALESEFHSATPDVDYDSFTARQSVNSNSAKVVRFDKDTIVEGTDGYNAVYLGESAANKDLAVFLHDGNDTIHVWRSTGNGYLDAGAGDDVINAASGRGHYHLVGGLGADQLKAGAGDDTLYADYQDTVIHGNGGNDTVIFNAADQTHFYLGKENYPGNYNLTFKALLEADIQGVEKIIVDFADDNAQSQVLVIDMAAAEDFLSLGLNRLYLQGDGADQLLLYGLNLWSAERNEGYVTYSLTVNGQVFEVVYKESQITTSVLFNRQVPVPDDVFYLNVGDSESNTHFYLGQTDKTYLNTNYISVLPDQAINEDKLFVDLRDSVNKLSLNKADHRDALLIDEAAVAELYAKGVYSIELRGNSVDGNPIDKLILNGDSENGAVNPLIYWQEETLSSNQMRYFTVHNGQEIEIILNALQVEVAFMGDRVYEGTDGFDNIAAADLKRVMIMLI